MQKRVVSMLVCLSPAPDQITRVVLLNPIFLLNLFLAISLCNLTICALHVCVIRIKCHLLKVMHEWIWYQQMESDWECGCPQPVVPASGAGEVPVSATEGETAYVPKTCYWEGLVRVRRVRGSAAAARVGQQVTAPVPDAGCWGWQVPVTSRKWACLSRPLANFKLDLPVSRSCWVQAGISGRQESVLLSRATCECGVPVGRAWVRSVCGTSVSAECLRDEYGC